MADYKYDVFISYSSADRPWALKLFQALTGRGFNVFLDKERIDTGKPWEPTLARAVQSSQHLVVLWTENADKSKWVARELGVFEAIVDPAVFAQAQANRRFIFLMLEGDNPAYTGMQALADLKEAQAYRKDEGQKGADAVAAGVWQTVVDRITEAVRDEDPSIPVPLAVLSMTEADLKKLDPEAAQEFGPSLNKLLAGLGVGTVNDLLANKNYGESRTDWRPFGSALNVSQIMNNMLEEVNAAVPQPRFRWEPIDEGFWTNLDVARRERDKLLSQLSVIVIDPLSLYDDLVFRRAFVTLSKCFESDKSIIMLLTPFSLPAPIVDLSALVEKRGDPYFNSYWNPPVPNTSQYAQLGMNIGDERGVRRLLRRTFGTYVRQVQPQSTPEYLKQGRG